MSTAESADRPLFFPPSQGEGCDAATDNLDKIMSRPHQSSEGRALAPDLAIKRNAARRISSALDSQAENRIMR